MLKSFFPLESEIRQECPLSPFLLNILLEVIDCTLKKEKGESPGSSEVRIQYLYCRGLGSIPGQETKILQTEWCRQNFFLRKFFILE